MASDIYQGLSIDLTNCLTQRNAELAEAKRVIASLIVAATVIDCDKKWPVINGRDWLKKYNDRMYPRAETNHE